MLAKPLARLLMDAGVPATATGARTITLHLPTLPPGTRCWLRLDRGCGPRADDPFYGWRVYPRLPKRLVSQASTLRPAILLAAWTALHQAGFLADPPPRDPALVDMDTTLA